MFWKFIFFHSEIAQYKEALLKNHDKAKILREEKECERESERERERKLMKDYVRYLNLNSMTKNVWSAAGFVSYFQIFLVFALRVTPTFFSFYFSVVFLDGLLKVIFKFFSNCCFKCVWPGSELLIWYAVCFQTMSFRYKQ